MVAIVLALQLSSWAFSWGSAPKVTRTSRSAVVPQAPMVSPEGVPQDVAAAERLLARRALLKAIEPLERGFTATSESRAAVSERIKLLIELNPITEPASQLGGSWTLLYTDAPDILFLPTTPFSSLGYIGQEIDDNAGTITNVIQWQPSSMVAGLASFVSQDTFTQRVITEYRAKSPTEVELTVRGLGVAPGKIMGMELPEALKIDAIGPIGLPFGNFQILYQDDEIRITRTDQGWYSVSQRDNRWP